MRISEYILFWLAKKLYSGQLCLDSEMKQALSSPTAYDDFRSKRFAHISEAAKRFQMDFQDRIVLDFGCSDGAIAPNYLAAGAREVFGVDIDRQAIVAAQQNQSDDRIRFFHSDTDRIPIGNESVDLVVSYDVFEHVAKPAYILDELHRVLRPGGQCLIGTWGWYHPFAPHLLATMPVPWAHVFFSERTLLRASRRVYQSRWYVPTMHDMDEQGRKLPDKYQQDEISSEYVNKLLIRDFERLFAASRFSSELHLVPFSSRWARWTKVLLRVPYLREFVAAYVWIVLERPKKYAATCIS